MYSGLWEDGLTVGQVSARLDVTVRTLHHWDEIGLASPSARSDSGYRLYGSRDLARLQRVTIYRELGLPLEEVARILDDPASDPVESLRAQRQRIAERMARLQELDTGIDRMIAAHEHGVLLTPAQQLEIFGEGWDPEWVLHARERWGSTPQWREYVERSAGRGPSDWGAIAAGVDALNDRLRVAFREGVLPGTEAAHALAEQHREVFSAYFPITPSMHVCLGRMYEGSPEYSAYYEALAPGLSSWLRRIIDANAAARGVDPATAVWE